MKQMRFWALALIAVCLVASARAAAESCTTSSEMNAAAKLQLQTAADQYFRMAQQGNTAALQQNAIFQLGDVVAANKDAFTGQAVSKFFYVLDNSQPSGQGAEFYCGIYPHLIGFRFGSLPPGQYAVVVQDVTGGKTPARVTWILQKSGTSWKIAGLTPKLQQIGGHDYAWFITQARAYRDKGEKHNAWFYYTIAYDLMRPLPVVTNSTLDELYDEMQKVMPPDLPGEKPADLVGEVCMPTATKPTCTPKTFRVTEIFPTSVQDKLNLVLKYQEPDISDTTKTFQENMAIIKALVTKYPELRTAFDGVVARAVAPNGQDYGSLLAMKDVK